MPGYSLTPLAKKLGINEGTVLCAIGAPTKYRALLEPMPKNVTMVTHVSRTVDIVHLFTSRRSELRTQLARCRKSLSPAATVWVSWPKKAAGVVTEITEDTIRAVALPLGFVDIKVCAVDEIWSGLKLVVRKALR